MQDVDSVLTAFLRSTDETDRKQLLSDLILIQATPHIRRTIRRRLGFYISQSGTNPSNPDGEDLFHEIITRLISRLNDLSAQPDKNPIKSYKQFVISVANNACNDYLREKSPERARLKNSLRELLDRHPDLKVWKGRNREQICGFAEWEGRRVTEAAAVRLKNPGEEVEKILSSKFIDESPQDVLLSKVVMTVFEWFESPIELEDLVEVVAELQGIKDLLFESIDQWLENPGRDLKAAARFDLRLESQEMLKKLWDEIKKLPPKERDAVCLWFSNENGDDLWSLLIDEGVITSSELISALNISPEDLTKLWAQIPMDSRTLAKHLGASVSQVTKWRHRAYKRLRAAVVKK
jgi:RNA polymerase sigma factor (sigma-70 family)